MKKNKMINLRYSIISKLIKYITPNLYFKINLLDVIGNKIRIKDCIPRPSILIMKEHFSNKSLIGVELGVKKGNNTKSILKKLNIKKLYLIDTWNNYKGIDGICNNINHYYKIVLDLFKNNNKVKIIKDFSKNAVKNFKNNSLDFIYIDANHKYDYVYQDIDLWYKKVKIGGIIAGHDIFMISDVLKAVKNYCTKNKIMFYIKLPDWYFLK